MKSTTAVLMALGLALPVMTFGQDEPSGRPPRGERPPLREGGPNQRPVPPLVAALDANRDGIVDEAEIKNASEALRKLDKNGDGKLTPEELRPPGFNRPPGEDGREPGPRGNRGPGNGDLPPGRKGGRPQPQE